MTQHQYQYIVRMFSFSLILAITLMAGGAEASSDIDREMAYINSLRSTADMDISLESTLPTFETPEVRVAQPAEAQVVAAAEIYSE